jgi:hypothetical protein
MLVRSAVAAALLLVGAACAQAQTASAPRAPGVTHGVRNVDSNTAPDTSGPDPTVDQTKPDSHQPETAVDKDHLPETAKDGPGLKPETATDKPKKTPVQKAADKAAQGVQSNTPPPPK